MSAGHATWAAIEGTKLTAIPADGGEHGVVLSRVGPLTADGGWAAYSLTFAAGPEFPLEQQMFRLRGGSLDETVFLVPSGRTREGVTLEATFAQIDEEAR